MCSPDCYCATAVMLACLKSATSWPRPFVHGGHLPTDRSVNSFWQIVRVVSHGQNAKREEWIMTHQRPLPVRKTKYDTKKFFSAYSRLGLRRAKAVSVDAVGAILMADCFASRLMSANATDPLPHCHVVTTTTHKNPARAKGGPMMGMISRTSFAKHQRNAPLPWVNVLDDGLFFRNSWRSGFESWLLAKAVAFGEGSATNYLTIAFQVVTTGTYNAFWQSLSCIISMALDNHCSWLTSWKQTRQLEKRCSGGVWAWWT